jgi:archaellum component FlaG (FlaF/FlaG flagellin family)
MFMTNSQSEQVKVTNAQSWVATDGTAATAFVIQNIGSKSVTVTDIKLRGIGVPVGSWYYCKNTGPGPCATQENILTSLPTDFDPASVTIGGQTYSTADPDHPMFSGSQLSLAADETAIMYLKNAGNIALIDDGNAYTLQIGTGKPLAVAQVWVERK